MQIQIAKWGNSLGIRIPKDIAAQVDFQEGTAITLGVEDHRVVLAPVVKPLTLDDIMAETTPEQYRTALSADGWAADAAAEIAA